MTAIGYLQVTRKCNQKCLFCSNPENENTLEMDDALNTLKELKENGYSGVILTGGEPTLCENLPKLIEAALDLGLFPRIISNGRKLAEKEYADQLIASGLRHVHLSVHSCKEKIQDFLTGSTGSLERIASALSNLSRDDIAVNINIVINKYNADHLDETVKWLVDNFPFIRHVVWNNLDPHMNRVEENRHVIPKLSDFEISLNKAATFLKRHNYTFRIERVPLCYMAEFAEYSTETRKIVKNEVRDVYFLDQRKRVRQENFFYEKNVKCENCTLNEICAGLYGGEKYYSLDELYPVFISKEKIIENIVSSA